MKTPENIHCDFRDALNNWASIAWLVAAGPASRDFFAHREGCHACTQAWRGVAGYLVQLPNLMDTLLANRGIEDVLRLLPRSDGPDGPDLEPSSAYATRAITDAEREGLRRLVTASFREHGGPELAAEWTRPPLRMEATPDHHGRLVPFPLPERNLELRAAAEGGTPLDAGTRVTLWRFPHGDATTVLRLRVPERPALGEREPLELEAVTPNETAAAFFEDRRARIGGVPLVFRGGAAPLTLAALRIAVGGSGTLPPLQLEVDNVLRPAEFSRQFVE